MSWILIIAIAFFLNACATAIDKFLLNNKISNPAVYAFIISVLSLIALVLAPWGFHLAAAGQIALALVAGIIFTFALLYMFKAAAINEISRVTPFIGGTQPVFSLVLAIVILGEWLNPASLFGIALLIAGTLIISWQKGKATRKTYAFALFSSFLYALSYVLSKQVFNDQGFISGFVWTRLGAFVGALLLLFIPGTWQALRRQIINPQRQTGGLLLLGQICGAVSAILVFYAISISPSVAIINASRGLEYVFLLLIVVMLSGKYPHLLEEKLTPKILLQKIAATALIVGGLIVLAIS